LVDYEVGSEYVSFGVRLSYNNSFWRSDSPSFIVQSMQDSVEVMQYYVAFERPVIPVSLRTRITRL
jgi:hypothetical protein